VSVSQGRRLTQNLTARLSRSVAVVDYLLPHFDTVHCLGYSLLNTAATATYFVGHCLLSLDTGDCSLSGVFCWTLSTVTGHWRLFTVRCILLDAVYAVRCSLLNTLASVIYFVEHTGNSQCILLDPVATVMNLLDTGDCSLSDVFCWTQSARSGVFC